MTRTILLADDSLTIQKVVELTFADTEYNVVAQSSGEELLQRLPEIRPDLVICDIIMPGKDGYEVCQEIKSDPNSLHIPVILLSGTFEPFDRDRALAAGCSEIITKPFEARKLVDCVERLLQGGADEQSAMEVEAVSPGVTEEIDLSVESPVQPVSPPDLPGQAVSSPPLAAVSALEVDSGPLGEVPGLEFTDTGFADMEAAALEPDGDDSDLPDDGLEFEFSDEHEAFGEPGYPAGTKPTDEAEAEEPTTEPELSVEAMTSPVEALPVEAPGAMDIEPPPEPFPEPGDETGPPVTDSSAPFMAPAVPPEKPVPAADESAIPPTTLPGETPLPEIDTFPDPEPEPTTEPEPGFAPVPEPEVVPEHGFTSDDQPEFAPEPETEPAPESEPPPAAAPPQIDQDTHPEPDHQPAPPLSEADTGPVDPETFKPVSDVVSVVSPGSSEGDAIEPAPSISATEGTGLSDADVERIARRLLELAADRIENIAWDVVPDMAEIVVRQRIRELEAAADQHLRDPSK